MTNPKIASWQAVFRNIDESGYSEMEDERASEIITGLFWRLIDALEPDAEISVQTTGTSSQS